MVATGVKPDPVTYNGFLEVTWMSSNIAMRQTALTDNYQNLNVKLEIIRTKWFMKELRGRRDGACVLQLRVDIMAVGTVSGGAMYGMFLKSSLFCFARSPHWRTSMAEGETLI